MITKRDLGRIKMRDLIWDALTVCGPVILAIMGAAITLWPPSLDGNARLYWLAAFIVVGIASAAAVTRELRSSHNLKSDLNEMIMGGEHFCYFKAIPPQGKSIDGPFQLWMFAPEGPVFDMNYWISPAGTTADDPRYGSLDVRKPLHQIIHGGGHAWDRALPPGDYRIEFDAKNGHWVESLKIFVENGELKQKIKVTGFGDKVLYEE